jgi:hypothetical protein
MDDDARRYFLDEPYILQIVTLDQIAALLRPLVDTHTSPLPVRLRTHLARMHTRIRRIRRELRRQPEAIAHERAREVSPLSGDA